MSAALLAEFLQLRQELNQYLDSLSNLAISDDRHMTYRGILEMFLWGNLSHANPHHQETFRAVSETPFFPLFQADFVATVRAFIRALRLMRADVLYERSFEPCA